MVKNLRGINSRLARLASDYTSTMACFYLFLAWSLLPLVDASSRDVVFYVSGGILQLVLLPLISVTTKREGDRMEERAAQDHAAIMEELQLHRAEMQELRKIEHLISNIRGSKNAIHEPQPTSDDGGCTSQRGIPPQVGYPSGCR